MWNFLDQNGILPLLEDYEMIHKGKSVQGKGCDISNWSQPEKNFMQLFYLYFFTVFVTSSQQQQ